MKKCIALTLALLLMGLAPIAAATQTGAPTAPAPQGGEYTFPDSGFRIALPDGWREVTIPGMVFSAAGPGTDQVFVVQVIPADGTALEDVADFFASGEEIDTVAPHTIGGVDFMLYQAVSDNVFGAFAESPAAAAYVHFMFFPLDDAQMEAVAEQVLASFTPHE